MTTSNKQPVTWDVVHVVNGKIIETIAYNKPLGIANWLKKCKQSTTHTFGEVKLLPNSRKH